MMYLLTLVLSGNVSMRIIVPTPPKLNCFSANIDNKNIKYSGDMAEWLKGKSDDVEEATMCCWGEDSIYKRWKMTTKQSVFTV